MTYGVQVLFFIVFVCNTPYNFFPGKLSIMNIISEYQQNCFSEALEKRINKQQGGDDYLRADLVAAAPGDEETPLSAAAEEEGEIDVTEITDDKTHMLIVVIYSVSISIIAMLTEDLSLILGIYSSFCECFMDFFLPAVLAYAALRYKKYNMPCLKMVTMGWFGIGLFYWAVA